MIEKEIETWSDFIEEFLKEGGIVYENNKQKREVVALSFHSPIL